LFQSKSNRTTKPAADKIFNTPPREQVEEFNARVYRESEEARITAMIDRQRQQRLERDAAIPPTKQRNKQRGRLSKQRIPATV